MNSELSIKVFKPSFGSKYYSNGMGWELNGENLSTAILAVIAKHYLHTNNITHVNINEKDIEIHNLFDNDILKEEVPYLEKEDLEEDLEEELEGLF